MNCEHFNVRVYLCISFHTFRHLWQLPANYDFVFTSLRFSLINHFGLRLSTMLFDFHFILFRLRATEIGELFLSSKIATKPSRAKFVFTFTLITHCQYILIGMEFTAWIGLNWNEIVWTQNSESIQLKLFCIYLYLCCCHDFFTLSWDGKSIEKSKLCHIHSSDWVSPCAMSDAAFWESKKTNDANGPRQRPA